MNDLGSFTREKENLVDAGGAELRKVGLVPDFVGVDFAAISGGNGTNKVAPILDVSWLRGGAGLVDGFFQRAGGGPSGREAEREKNAGVVLAGEGDVGVESVEPKLAFVRLQIRPRDVSVPKAPLANRN